MNNKNDLVKENKEAVEALKNNGSKANIWTVSTKNSENEVLMPNKEKQ